MTKEIGVLLADDHPIIEAAARAILAREPDINLLAAAYDGAQAQHLACLHQPDILLLDLYMPGPCAEETVQNVQRCSPRTKIVIFTACDDESEVRSMVAMKVAGYMLKNELSARVVEAMRTVAQGGFWFSQGILMKLVHHEPEKLPSSPAIPLTEMERALLQLLVNGQSDLKIALAMSMGERTVRKYLGCIYDKLGVTGRVQAAVKAVRMGLVE